MELYQLSAAEIVKGVKDHSFTCTDVVKSCLSRIEELEPSVHAMLYVASQKALDRAA